MPKLTKKLLETLIREELKNIENPSEQSTSQASSADIVASANVTKKLGELKGKIEQFKKDIMGDASVEIVNTSLADLFRKLEDEITKIHKAPGEFIVSRSEKLATRQKTVQVKPTVPSKNVV
jgi:hypothetical protein